MIINKEAQVNASFINKIQNSNDTVWSHSYPMPCSTINDLQTAAASRTTTDLQTLIYVSRRSWNSLKCQMNLKHENQTQKAKFPVDDKLICLTPNILLGVERN